jgi:metallophosphoesterase superfamily enzyme
VELAEGASALPGGVLWLHRSQAIVAADAHLGYEDVIGGVLPMWSTAELIDTLLAASKRMNAREIVLLGDVIHGSRMSEGAARAVQQGLQRIRAVAKLTLVAGNHEGRTRGAHVIGETVEHAQRDGWLLSHGDKPSWSRSIIGHLHPSLPVGGGKTTPAFLSAPNLIVVPALTPYSRGLNVLSEACLRALQPFGVRSRSDLQVVASTRDRVYPFGELSKLRDTLADL